ncbi:pre-mRNA 3' end processing protein WDR33 isoform X3 [Callithrix jacchus]|uniref:pre-mRNA 3' end processing protein WDR33 isoform X4 n=1 Tax=Callithrix jacchus TaxID=9483 RepID=UPI00159DEF73|nr:pre-mRNA 3' end processing protein WDR33 isoform X4 [Callithrix jacchus]
MATEIGSPPRFFHMPRFQHQAPRQLFYKRPDFAQQQAMQQLTFDGKRMRKAVNRKTIDYNPSVIKYLENRIWQRDQRDMRAIQPDAGYYNDLVPPIGMLNNPMNAVTTKFVRTSTNKVKCPVFVVRWTPEGRRLVTGASSGEFTLWNGLTFNFETILQAHDSPVRAMTWSHNDMWMLTADHGGYVKYWQSNMNNVKMFQAHKEAIREASFSPTDNKFATCSDDGTVRIWDFLRCHEERILRVCWLKMRSMDQTLGTSWSHIFQRHIGPKEHRECCCRYLANQKSLWEGTIAQFCDFCVLDWVVQINSGSYIYTNVFFKMQQPCH